MEKVKRGNVKSFAGIFSIIIFSMTFISATCDLDVSLINQDPYPAIPNDYVKIMFQIKGVSNPDCKGASIELVPEYPFYLDSNDSIKTINYGTYVPWHNNYWNVPYKLRIDKDALDGENEIKINYSSGSNKEGYLMKKFNITIEDSRTDFDVAIQDYSTSLNTITLSISNIGDSDANSVTVEIPSQTTIEMKGSNKNIVGNIEANDYTSINFKAIPKEDGEIVIKIFYTDEIGVRREVEKRVLFSKNYYQETKEDDFSGVRPYVYIVIGIIGIILLFLGFRYFTRKKKRISESKKK